MAYGKTKVVVNAGGMTQAQASLIIKLADQKAWNLHNSSKMREWFAMHIFDIENNPATSVLTGGWHGTASAFIAELQKLPARSQLAESGIVDRHGEDIPTIGELAIEKKSDEIHAIEKLLVSDPWEDAATTAIAHSEHVSPVIEKELVPEGVYVFENQFYAVKNSRTPGRRYAYLITEADKKFVHTYAKGLIYKLTDDMRADPKVVLAMNLDTVRVENGKRIGSCCVCGKTLRKKESVDRGIGPVCGGRVGI